MKQIVRRDLPVTTVQYIIYRQYTTPSI